MTTTRKRRRKGRRREALVHSHLEHVSRDLLEKHPDVVRDFIGRNAGIYALYKRDKLYYVGLATGLAWRLRSHKRNRHGDAWDRFSIYLTIKDQHLREIESLVLQIADPKGNKQGGKPSGSKDMRRRITAAIRLKQKKALAMLFEQPRRGATSPKKTREASRLQRLLPAGAPLRGTFKGKSFRARALKDGRVRYKGNIYASLSAAATVAVKHPKNGWWFWQVERGKGNWTRLTQIRKAGTAIYTK